MERLVVKQSTRVTLEAELASVKSSSGLAVVLPLSAEVCEMNHGPCLSVAPEVEGSQYKRPSQVTLFE